MAADSQPAKKKSDDGIWETIKIVLQALVIAFFIRLLIFQPFNIPSGSMIPTLRIGDFLFVNKLSYGYGPYSFNFTAGLFGYEAFSVPRVPIEGRTFFASEPKRGDVVVFKLPRDNKTDFIKRVIGLPGDKIQIIESVLHINGQAVKRLKIKDYVEPLGQGHGEPVTQYKETLPNGVSYTTHDLGNFPGDNTQVYEVPKGHYFMLGDNRDNSSDSRFSAVGYVPYENLVGRATFIFFSHERGASFWKFWRWPVDIRWSRFFNRVHG